MSLTTDSRTPTLDAAGPGPATPVSDSAAAEISAAWAGSGEFGDHVVYERNRRWTFAAGVRARVIVTRSEVIVDDRGRRTTTAWHGDPADALAAATESLSIADWRLYGWVGFDFCAPYHGILDRVPDDTVLAHLIVPEFEAFVDADGVDTGTADPERARLLLEISLTASAPGESRPVDVRVDSEDYRSHVATAVAEIAAGRYQKVILSRAVDIPFPVDIPATYARGRADNTPARSYLLSLGDLAAAGFSPELVVAVHDDRTVVTEPLAGTRAFGISTERDAAARAELLGDAKEVAEHAMSVRACFDEIASISAANTTAVSEFMEVRERGSVQHLASTVKGTLADGETPWRALEVVFPSITASGVPKTPAVEAIDRLESRRRGPYSGAILVASSSGELEATLALRTVFATGGKAWLRAGAGIVAQSTPEREFEETCEKLGSVAPYVIPR
ncbi:MULTISPECIES: salicylate synthase [Gordonia]|uniref:Salicylate synthase n=1 Tax=Gordonia amicalis TaxID=89053 RepID=A0ABU4DE56_9ACTN|nr:MULTISPECIES: salicylate synthase [Gordonia]ATD69315.1 salicylate synthase [Gordonia sp. 1D]MDJ0451967.1 salicylate synthase [Gordonia amicalis]MDV6308022.1 salicylate synthase [Gordonia amicalis]MDV7076231.1 salicylate synthase [Gordonia amicalis]